LCTLFSVSPCDSVTCQNEGTCVVEAGVAVCYCKGDYSGATCSGENNFFLDTLDYMIVLLHAASASINL